MSDRSHVVRSLARPGARRVLEGNSHFVIWVGPRYLAQNAAKSGYVLCCRRCTHWTDGQKAGLYVGLDDIVILDYRQIDVLN